MKIDKTEIAFVIVAGVLSLGLVVGPAHASPRPAAPQNQQNPQSAEQQDVGPESQIFVGTVSRIPEDNPAPSKTWMIYDDSHRANFFLDDPNDAARFEGERAKVEGTLDGTDHAIRVESIHLFRPQTFASMGK
jgi:hypothetical protein